MKIMAIVASAIYDICHRTVNYNHTGKKYIKIWIREEGWTFGKKICVQPVAKEERKVISKTKI